MGRFLGALMLLILVLPGSAHAALEPLPLDTDVDYQLGGGRTVGPDVGIVVRDRRSHPIAGRYNVCYLNAFQTQPDEAAFWKRRPALILRHRGRPVVDQTWGEKLLDTRTPAKRQRLVRIIGAWIDGCSRAGFEGVEFDNLDSFTRSKQLIKPAHNVAFARLLVARAHRAGLAAGQKNWAQWNGRRAGFDFVVAEECGRFRECGAYVRHYGRQVLVIEYRRSDFQRTCTRWGDQLAVVLRDRGLSATGRRAFC